MNKRNNCVAAVIGAVLMGVSTLASAGGNDTLLAHWGQFQLDNGESKTVIRGDKLKAYRVCMDEGTDAVALKVTFDDQEVVVEPGECQLIEATKVKLASAGKLQQGMTLIGSFNFDSKRNYPTSAGVPVAARND